VSPAQPAPSPAPAGHLARHLAASHAALDALASQLPRLEAWGAELGRRLASGRRLLVAGNGGSAALAQHLSAEVVGRYRTDRRPYDALALHVDSSIVTAIVNDYGAGAVFARQVGAYGRPGDVLLALSTSGRSGNLLAAVATAPGVGATTWCLTGRAPNPLAGACDDAITVDADAPHAQEAHQVAVHLLCEALEAALAGLRPPAGA
jgi:phosphoheptose isomerase